MYSRKGRRGSGKVHTVCVARDIAASFTGMDPSGLNTSSSTYGYAVILVIIFAANVSLPGLRRDTRPLGTGSVP